MRAGSGEPHRFKSGMNKTTELQSKVANNNASHLPWCPDVFILQNYVGLPQRDNGSRHTTVKLDTI